jgi:serine/threonine protein kinase
MSSARPTDHLVGRLLAGRYRVVRRLEEGGMGALYVAMQEPLGREIALKVLRREYAADATAVQRFHKEAQAVSRLSHPNIVTVFDFGQDEGHLFLAMELVRGKSLRQVLDSEGPFSWRRSLRVIHGVTNGLVEAHESGIIHRDLKPENVMLTSAGVSPEHVKLLDFGLARSVTQDPDDPKLTQQNAIPGTPGYMPPERVNGLGDELRGDLYSLGALWFELLTGRLPFPAETAVKMLVRHLHDPAPSPRAHGADAQTPAAGDALVLRLLAKRPEDRPASAVVLLGLLQGLEENAWSVASAAQIAAAGTSRPSHPGWAHEPSNDFDFAPALESLSSLEEGDDDDEPIELLRRKEDVPVLLTRRKSDPIIRTPILDEDEAAARLSGALSLETTAETVVDFLRARFDGAGVLDLRSQPIRVVASEGFGPAEDVAKAVERTDALWRTIEGGEAYYGAPLEGDEWRAFHAAVAGGAPAGLLLAALRRDGRPALLVVGVHTDGPLLRDLMPLGRLMREMASSLTHFRF